MTKKTSGSQQSSSERTRANDRSDSLKVNKGTTGSNITNSRVHGNRGKQLNPNQQ